MFDNIYEQEQILRKVVNGNTSAIDLSVWPIIIALFHCFDSACHLKTGAIRLYHGINGRLTKAGKTETQRESDDLFDDESFCVLCSKYDIFIAEIAWEPSTFAYENFARNSFHSFF